MSSLSLPYFLSPFFLRGAWLCGLLWLAGGIPRVQAQMPPRRVVVALVPGLRADDLTRLSLPGLTALRAEGAAGWMTGRAARAADRAQLAPDGRDTSASLALTLGSGARALALSEGSREEEKKRRKEEEKTPFGHPHSAIPTRQSTIINRQLDHAVPVGALGDMIHRQGWQTAVCGNADTDTANEDGLLLTMDRDGRVDYTQTFARAGEAEAFAPYGRQDDVAALVRVVTELPPRYALIVLVFGDLERADRYGPLCLPMQREFHRDRALRSLDSLLLQLRQRLSATAARPITAAQPTPASSSAPPFPPRLYLLAPAPARSTPAEDRLVPFLVWGKDVPAGALFSPSTRVPGIGVNTDFLPTIAEALRLSPPSGAIGRPITTQPSRLLSLTDWRVAHDRLLQSERLKNVYGGLPTLQLLLTLGALLAFHRNRRRLACAIVTAIVALPLGMLLLPAVFVTPLAVSGAGAALAGFTLLFVLLAWRGYDSANGVPRLLFGLFTALLIILSLDLVSGSHLLRQAWMSYSILESARFYGIGNEYMGVVIGAMCIALGNGQQATGNRWGKPEAVAAVKSEQLAGRARSFYSLFPVACCLLLLFLLGYTRFGAKVGAIPSAGVAWGVELLILWRGRLRLRDVIGVGVVTLLLLGALAWLDMRHGAGEQSHLARAAAGSGGSLVSIARRKLLLEGYLLLRSPWSAALLGAAGGWSVVSGQWSVVRKKRQGDKETRRQGDAGREAGGRGKEKDESRQGVAGRLEADGEEKVEAGQDIERRSGNKSRDKRATTGGLVAGAIASLLCNDSGVTAAAMILLFGFAWALAQADCQRTYDAEHA